MNQELTPTPPISYHMTPRHAEQALDDGIKFLRHQIQALKIKSDKNFYIFETAVSTGLGAVLGTVAFKKNLSKTFKIFFAIGAGASAIYAGVSALAAGGVYGLETQTIHIKNYLDQLEQNPQVRERAIQALAQHTPHGVFQDGHIEFNHFVVANHILNFGKNAGLLDKNISIDAVALSFIAKPDLKLLEGRNL